MKIATAITVAMAINLGLTSDQLEKAALDYKMTFDADYVQDEHYYKTNAAAASLLAGYLLINSQSEGGFSVSFNTEQIENRIKWLANNSGGLFELPVELQKLDRRVRAVYVQ